MPTSCIRRRAPRPAVLVWPDIFGLRPAFRQMGKRLAESGYSVLTINPFYRVKHAPTGASTDFQDPAKRDRLDEADGRPYRGNERHRREGLHRVARQAVRASTPRRRSAPRATAWVARS